MTFSRLMVPMASAKLANELLPIITTAKAKATQRLGVKVNFMVFLLIRGGGSVIYRTYADGTILATNFVKLITMCVIY
jgi:hypothetical protein